MSKQLFDRATKVIPGGVNSPVRAFGSVGGTCDFIASASGAKLTTSEGRELIDLVGSWGPALLGHAHPEVVAAVQDAAARGLSFGAPTEAEIELAEVVAARVPGADQVRLVSTGTEATMTAIRLARGATGREKIIKFAGCYHGHSDGLLAAAGSGVATAGLPGSAGVTRGAAADTIVCEFGNLEDVRAAFDANPDQIAAIITEPAPANMGVIKPKPGFNAALAATAHEHGALLIVDEVLTGFRVHPSGWLGWEAEHGTPVDADLVTLGKVVGGGLPLAAIAGRRELMSHLAPVGKVYQAGTLSGNPLATTAGIATLRLATADVYERIGDAAETIGRAASEALSEAGVPHVLSRASNLFSVFIGVEQPVTNYAEAQQQDTEAYARFFHSLHDSGVALPPSAFEAWFISAAHDQQIVDQIVSALPAAAKAARS